MSTTNFSGDLKRRGRPSKPVDPNSIGGRIRVARERKSLSLEEAAARVRLTDGMLSHAEIGRRELSETALRALAYELEDDFGLDWLTPYAKEQQEKSKPQLPLNQKIYARLENLALRFKGDSAKFDVVALEILERYANEWEKAEHDKLRKEEFRFDDITESKDKPPSRTAKKKKLT